MTHSMLSKSLFAMARMILMPMRGRRLSVLNFHRVHEQRDVMRPYDPTVAEFRWQMQIVKRHFTVLSLDEALDCLASDSLPANALCITFDDGYADNLLCAQRVLSELEMPWALFVATGFLNGGVMWNDMVIEAIRLTEAPHLDLREIGLPIYPLGTVEQRRDCAEKAVLDIKHVGQTKRQEYVDYIVAQCGVEVVSPMLTSEQLQQLSAAGVAIGGHTVTHPILANQTYEQCVDEIKANKNELEAIVGREVSYFAYPNGKRDIDFTSVHEKIVDELGFRAAFSTNWGAASSSTNVWALPRFAPWDKTQWKYLLRMLLNERRAL